MEPNKSHWWKNSKLHLVWVDHVGRPLIAGAMRVWRPCVNFSSRKCRVDDTTHSFRLVCMMIDDIQSWEGHPYLQISTQIVCYQRTDMFWMKILCWTWWTGHPYQFDSQYVMNSLPCFNESPCFNVIVCWRNLFVMIAEIWQEKQKIKKMQPWKNREWPWIHREWPLLGVNNHFWAWKTFQ